MKTTPVFSGLCILISIIFLTCPVSATDKPVASFISNVSSGSSPLSVQFIDSSLNSPTSWTWLFGDGGSSTSPSPVHTYANSGEYTITLIVSNTAGSDTLTKTGYISVAKATSPPGVDFVANVSEGAIPLSVQFLDSSENSPTSWVWSFGDGGTSLLQNPTHTYTNSGTFTVTLTATNSGGSNTLSRTNYIVASKVTDAPDPLFKSSTNEGFAPLYVQFVDVSDNSPTSWIWSFGDGATSSLQNPTHTYTSAGDYTVTLTASNSVGSNTVSKTGYISVEAAEPVAAFTANVTSGVKPLVVQFMDTSTNAPTGWYWKFSDGGVSTSQNPIHTFTSAGTYSVSLGATNTAGSNTSTVTGYITVANEATLPISSFTADIRSGTAPLTVQFTDTSENSPNGWQWSFGDGTQSTERDPEHTYSKSGSYSVSLTAVNAGGHNTTTKPGYISVIAASSVTQSPVPSATTAIQSSDTEDNATSGSNQNSATQGGSSSWILPFIGIVVLVIIIAAVLLYARGGGSGKRKRRSRGGGDL